MPNFSGMHDAWCEGGARTARLDVRARRALREVEDLVRGGVRAGRERVRVRTRRRGPREGAMRDGWNGRRPRVCGTEGGTSEV